MTALDEALHYHRLGWAIIPIKPGTKKPACRSWKPFQRERSDEARLKRWFPPGTDKGLAVVLGEVSGGLACRDFDEMAAYDLWTQQNPETARRLPTVATGRPGRHVYFRVDIGRIREASPSNGAIIDLGDGELRGGGYCVLPPSKHPSGVLYRWLDSPPNEVPFVDDLDAAGLLSACATESNRDNRRIPRKTEEIVGVGVLVEQPPLSREVTGTSGWSDDIQRAILESLPTGPGKRHRQVFQLARALKSIPALQDAPARELEPYVRTWHELAKPVINTQPFEETWIDFLRGWPKVRFPKGAEPMAQIITRAVELPIPKAAERYEQHAVRTLVSLCRELQRAAGENPFYLSCRTAGRLLGVHYGHISRWLFLLKVDGVLLEVEKGNQKTRRASRYRYLADM